MTDLDFDELDQAVSSAMGGTSDQPKPVRSAAVAAPAPAVVPEKPIKIVSSRTSTPVAKRSTGRFMDVVHPSSDMRPVSKPEADTAPVKTPEAPAPEAPAATSDWPDPLDFHGFKMDEPETPAKTSDADAKKSDDSSDDAPLSSPFLSGAKVEKRPLGAFSPADEKPAAATQTASKPSFALPDFKLPGELKDESSATEDNLTQSKNDDPIPPEFHSDLLSVESDASLTENTNESPDTVKDASLVADEKPAQDVKKAATPAPMPSIVQQYKEKAASKDQSSGAIYDTETYHKPIATVPKKKNGLWIIVWILGLLAIGGAIGAAMYFYVLPLLV